MKKVLASCVILCCTFFSFGQSQFEIKNLGSSYSESQINQAFTSANFCGLIKETIPSIIVLDDGAEIQLNPANQSVLDASCAQADDFVFPEATWKISSTGVVVRSLSGLYIKNVKH